METKYIISKHPSTYMFEEWKKEDSLDGILYDTFDVANKARENMEIPLVHGIVEIRVEK